MVMSACSGDDHPIRLAIVVSHPIPYFCSQYLSWSRLDGIELRVFFASRHGLEAYFDKDFASPVQWDGLTLDFPHEFLPGATQRPVAASLDVPAVEGRLAEFGPHVLFVYGYGQRLQRRSATWARKNRVPILMVTDSELRSKRSWIKRSLKALFLPQLLAKVDGFLTVGDANEAYLRRYGISDERLVRSYFPIEVKCFDQAYEARPHARATVRAKHGIPDHHLVLLMVGKLAEWKRQQDLVTFSNRIGGVRNDITVVLAGSGRQEPALQRLAQTQGPGGVVFAGFVQPQVLARYYSAADVYVHCSELDPCPLAISEAVYSGLPVVVSDRCGNYGPSDCVRPGLNGYVYPCADVGAMASVLSRVLESPDRREAMGRASRRIGQSNQRLAHGEALLQALDCLGFSATRRKRSGKPEVAEEQPRS